VSDRAPFDSALSLLTLRSIRQYIRRSHAVMMTVFFAVLYALGSMALGGMLILAHVGGGYTVLVLWGSTTGFQAWNYPGLLILAPWGVVTLPFFATLSMVLVSVGVGIGMAVAVLLAVTLVRRRTTSVGRPAAVGSVAGLTPAMIALVTLGACCSTSLAASAGVGIVAQVSGSTTDNLLVNNWYLGVFQVVVVWVALVAQELLLRVYGGLLGLSADPAGTEPAYQPPKVSRRFLAGSALRVGLLVGGLTWSIAMLVDWTSVAPFGASAALWFRWLAQHQLLALLAIVAALFPRGLSALFSRWAGTALGRVARGVLLVVAVSLAVGVPPPIAGWGVTGFGNELMGLLAVPAGWGAVAPVFPPGLDLYFRWGVQYLLLGGFATALALGPSKALAPIEWTVGQPARDRLGGSDPLGSPTPSAIPTAEGTPAGASAVPSR
jgi:hypothetical protein